MATFFLPEAGDTPGCHPLTLTRKLGDLPLANVTLRRHQLAVLLAVGVTIRMYTVVLTSVNVPLVPPVAVTLLVSKPVTASAKV